jgi:hypothetical protein
MAANVMPARPMNDGHAAFDIATAQVGEEAPLLVPVDAQAFVGKATAEHRRIALQSRVGHVASMNSSVGIAPAQPFPPTAPVWITASAYNLEGRGNPNRLSRRVVATAFRNFGRETLGVHFERAPRHEFRPRLIWLGEPESRLAQRRYVLPLGNRVRRIPTLDRLALTTVRRHARQRHGVDNGNPAPEPVKYGRHFACIFRSHFVRIRPYQHAPPGKRFEIRCCLSLATARRSYADAFRKDQRRRINHASRVC